MRKYGYLVVEGPHDVEFVYRLLSPFNIKRVGLEQELDPFLSALIPRSYPPDGDLQKRMSIPLFLQSDTHAIAIHNAGGDSRLVSVVEENSALLDLKAITGIGLLLDSDKIIPADERYADIKNRLAERNFLLDDKPSVITQGHPIPHNSADAVRC